MHAKYIYLLVVLSGCISTSYCQGCWDSISTTTCHFIHRMGQCSSFQIKCAKTCGFCSPAPSTWNPTLPVPQARACEDKSSTCRSIAAANLCNANPMVLENCQKSCGQCSDFPSRLPFPTAPRTTQRTTTRRFWTTPRPSTWSTIAWSIPPHLIPSGINPKPPHTARLTTTTSATTTTRTTTPRTTTSKPTPPPTYWTKWTVFTTCTKSCGKGVKRRTRVCRVKGLCKKGLPMQMKYCNTIACPATTTTTTRKPTTRPTTNVGFRSTPKATRKWMVTKKPFTKSTPRTTAKTATRTSTTTTRTTAATTATTPKTTPNPVSKSPNNPYLGRWKNWGKFSPCDVTCGNGYRVRTRVCEGEACKGASKHKKRCMLRACREWAPWGAWSRCSRSCGGKGVRSRIRKCIPRKLKCPGPIKEVGDCTTPPCPKPVWGKWSEWSKCTRTCGTGSQSKDRKCDSGTCRGQSKLIRKCNQNKCEVSSEEWSLCTKSCGTGTRSRFVSSTCTNLNDDKCLREFAHCNTRPCPKAICALGETPRYGIPHSCCKVPRDFAHGNCGLSYSSSRILNGFASKVNQWPWMVYLDMGGNLCGGTILTNEWAVTAAHCMYDKTKSQVEISNIRARVGINKRSDSQPHNEYGISEVILHPNYRNVNNDVALIKFSRPLSFSVSVRSLCLPNGETPPIDTTCFAMGWGITDKYSLRASNELMEVPLQNLDMGVCRKAYDTYGTVKKYVQTSNKLLCAGHLKSQVDSCLGDSGGPLVCQRCQSCAWYLAGVTSFGPESCGTKGVPGMYTKVAEFEAWIRTSIGLETPPNKSSCIYKVGP